MKKTLTALLLASVTFLQAAAQIVDQNGNPVDTTKIYRERKDSLKSAVFVSAQGSHPSKFKDMRVEAINSAGLQKMACCNLAESFENSASVTVGYSDATTGARQIRLLGLSGIYTQMLDENRPVMRGLAAPFGLSYVPGQWLSSIQVAKGASSVINGGESITGTINLEHRKPTDEIPLFVNLSTMADSKTDFNIVSSQQIGDRWSTVAMGHVSGNFKTMDMNGDTFVDDPRQLQFNVSNRWLYYAPKVRVRFGFKAVSDSRQGGQLGMPTLMDSSAPWTSDIRNNSLNTYFKIGIPFSEDAGTSLGIIGDWTIQDMDSEFGFKGYDATQNSGFLNFIYQREVSEEQKFTIGASGTMDAYSENLAGNLVKSNLGFGGIYGEYTFKKGENFSLIAALRGDWYKGEGLKAIPRLTLRWNPAESLVLRANAGRGLRFSTPVIDNIGILSTGKEYVGDLMSHTLEDAWTTGANATWYFPFLSSYLSLDWFRTGFTQQKVIEYAEREIKFFDLTSVDDGRSFTSSYQADFYIEPAERFNITATFRYTDARMTLSDGVLHEKPMTSRYKGVLNMQYALPLNKWIFDFTASVNGPARKWDFMGGGLTPAYPLLYAQITKRFKGFDIYAGGENLTGFRQKEVIIGDPFSDSFDASQVWGPIMGTKLYVGFRITIWKTA